MTNLDILMPRVEVEDQLCGACFLARYHLYSTGDFVQARRLFLSVVKTAQMKGWPYFVARAVFGLAEAEACGRNQNAMAATLDLLRAFTDGLKLVHLANVVSAQFQEPLSQPFTLAVDRNRSRLRLGVRWIDMAQRPRLMRFFACLIENGQKVEKSTLAAALWPDQAFARYSHVIRTDLDFLIWRRALGVSCAKYLAAATAKP